MRSGSRPSSRARRGVRRRAGRRGSSSRGGSRHGPRRRRPHPPRRALRPASCSRRGRPASEGRSGCLWLHLVLAYQFTHRSAAQVHKGLRLGQHHFVAGDARSRRLRTAIAIVHAHAALFGNAVHRQKTHIVRCELVLDARIAEPDDQLHRAYFFFSDFSDFSAFSGLAALSPPSAASPAVSCLPFLMTSRSVAVASASTTPSTGAASTTSFTAVTWATACVMN